MEQNSISQEAYEKLLKAILPIILKNGMKGTTMDKVASTLSMSKRTLYEIFASKEEMLKAVIELYHNEHFKTITRIFNESGTIIEAFYHIFKVHQRVMEQASSDFFRDMDSSYAKLRHWYDDKSDTWQTGLLKTIDAGIEQGVCRPDVNYPVILRMFRIQMESLKRMEEFLPSDVTISEAFDTVSMSFLRSIASRKGIEILEKVRKEDLEKDSKTRQNK